jgi:hypothetical protein
LNPVKHGSGPIFLSFSPAIILGSSMVRNVTVPGPKTLSYPGAWGNYITKLLQNVLRPCHTLTLEPFISLYWLGQDVTWVDSLVFYFLCWPWYGSQSEAAVYRCLWLGILFFPYVWDLDFVLLLLDLQSVTPWS